MIYSVSYSWYKSYPPLFLEGDECKNWKKLCDKVVLEAIEKTVKESPKADWIGWPEIQTHLISLFDDLGYKSIEIEEAVYSGGGILDDECDVVSKMWEHNQKVSESFQYKKHK